VLLHFSIMEEQKKYQSINHRINQSVRYYRVPSSVEKGAALNSLLKKIENSPGQQAKTINFNPILRWAAGIAAAAAIVVAIILFPAKQTIQNTTGQSFSYRLPDQSRVILTEGSLIEYSKAFKNREVKLIGEGYFEVATGKSFQVITSAGSVQVLGTRFSVNEKGEILEVKCYEGSVKAANNETGYVLQSGEGVRIKSTSVEVMALSDISYPTFALFNASYSNTEVKEIFNDMQLFFGVSIQPVYTGSRYYTGTFETGSLETALILLCEPLGFSFTFENDKMIVIK
jgi:transmembrane sensor